MRSQDEHTEPLEGTGYRELRLLEEVDQTPDVSQRQLARQVGIALGVANLLVRRLASRGYIKVTQLRWKRWAYVLTPAGVARKLNLTLAYIDRFIAHYRRVRHLLRDDIGSLPLNEESHVALVGTTEIAELAFLGLKELGVEEIEVFDRDGSRPRFLGMRVQKLSSIDPGRYARVVIADSVDGKGSRDELYAFGFTDSQVVELFKTRGQ